MEPGEEEVSAWCKLHGEEFKGKKIPYGAKVFFKPNVTRDVEQGHKFDSKAIPGIFAGYAVAVGMNGSGHYKVWPLDEFTQQNLAFNAERPIFRLLKPDTVREVVMSTPLSFPLKDSYEKTNTTLEGLKDKEQRHGDPEIPQVADEPYEPESPIDDIVG